MYPKVSLLNHPRSAVHLVMTIAGDNCDDDDDGGGGDDDDDVECNNVVDDDDRLTD